MPAIRHISSSHFIKGTWRNGRGISWDIASDRPGECEFGWRFAIAEIAASGPFSLYGAVDRVFMLIEGEGVDLTFEGGATLAVHERFAPHHFACDIATECRLQGPQAKALNLFTARGRFSTDVKVDEVNGTVPIALPASLTLLFALQGTVEVDGILLAQNDAAEARGKGTLMLRGQNALLYVCSLMGGER